VDIPKNKLKKKLVTIKNRLFPSVKTKYVTTPANTDKKTQINN